MPSGLLRNCSSSSPPPSSFSFLFSSWKERNRAQDDLHSIALGMREVEKSTDQDLEEEEEEKQVSTRFRQDRIDSKCERKGRRRGSNEERKWGVCTPEKRKADFPRTLEERKSWNRYEWRDARDDKDSLLCKKWLEMRKKRKQKREQKHRKEEKTE